MTVVNQIHPSLKFSFILLHLDFFGVKSNAECFGEETILKFSTFERLYDSRLSPRHQV